MFKLLRNQAQVPSPHAFQIYQHDSGLHLIYMEKKAFRERFAAVGVNVGAAVLDFAAADGERRRLMPGSAHYLEHCLFDRDDEGGLVRRISDLGCDANAYTSYTETVFHVSGFERCPEAFLCLLDALLQPQLDAARLDAERGIIRSEIEMYRDEPLTRAYMQLLHNLYRGESVRNDIAGTLDDIEAIRPDMLQALVRQFYTPARFRICLCGDFDAVEGEMDTFLNELDARLNRFSRQRPSQPANPTTVHIQAEDAEVVQETMDLWFDVENPLILWACKRLLPPVPDTQASGLRYVGGAPRQTLDIRDLQREELSVDFYLESLFGDCTDWYEKAYQEGRIHERFSVRYVSEGTAAYLLIVAESDSLDEAENLSAEVRERLREALLTPVSAEGQRLFQILQKGAIGRYLRALDSVEEAGAAALRDFLVGLTPKESLAALQQANEEDARRVLAFVLEDGAAATVRVRGRS